MQPLHFSEKDVSERPHPGWYAATIATACWRESSKKHRMVYVLVVLEGVASPYDRISDYFVLEGVTPQGIACSRRRLVTLFRAGGLPPQPGDEIQPSLLEGLKLEAYVALESWNGKSRLQIKQYRPALTPCPSSDDSTREDALVLADVPWPERSDAK